jgi:type IX secretion system PorP/SprF family membrane protein
MKKLLYILFVLCIINVKAQFDPQFTQYMFNESFINPAYAGSHDALSFTGLFRKQWVGFDGAPTNVTFSAHAPIANDKIGIGINFMNESIGVMKRNLGLFNFSYRIKINEGKLCLGFQGGVNSFQQNLASVKTIQANDNQFLNNTGVLYAPNFGSGIYYYAKKWFAGFSVPRLLMNTYNAKYSGPTTSLTGLTYYTSGGYVFDLNSNFKLRSTFMLKMAKGTPIQPEVNMHLIYKDVFWFGPSYRLNDAVAVLIGYQINQQFRVGYAYDYTISKFSGYNTGSHEVVLNYIFKYKYKNHTSPRLF